MSFADIGHTAPPIDVLLPFKGMTVRGVRVTQGVAPLALG